LRETRHIGKGNLYTVTDANGDMRAAEKWSDRTGIREPKNGVIYHADYFLSPEMLGFPDRPDEANSKLRCDSMERLLAEVRDSGEECTFDFMKSVAHDHAEARSAATVKGCAQTGMG